MDTPALLLVGESHYLPDWASQHLVAETWYSGSSTTLTHDEIEWISTAAIFEGARRDFASRTKHIQSGARRCGKSTNMARAYSDYTDVADEVALYNFFLRPGIKGDSLVVTSGRVARK